MKTLLAAAAFVALAVPSQQSATTSPAIAVVVTPATQRLDLSGHTFTRRETEYDPKTRVVTVYFDVEGLPSGSGTDGVILNFYGWNPPATPASIAEALRAKAGSTNMIFAFQAPDPATNTPAFFLTTKDPRLEKGYGYVDLTKVASIDGSAYAVTFSHRIMAKTPDQLDAQAKEWLLSDDAKGVRDALDKIGITGDWKASLAKQH